MCRHDANSCSFRFLQRLCKMWRLDDRQFEDRPHRTPHRSAEPRAATSLSDEQSGGPKCSATAHQASQILRAREPLNRQEKKWPRCRLDQAIQCDRRRHAADRQHTLVHGKSGELLQQLPLGGKNPQREFWPTREQLAIFHRPLLWQQEGDHLKITFEETTNDFLALGNEDSLVTVFLLPSHS